MARGVRLRCTCGRAVNAVPNEKCPSCKKLMTVPQDGQICFYRPFSIKAITQSFEIFLNRESYGCIGAGERVLIPVDFGKYDISMGIGKADIISVFLQRSDKLSVEITPENPMAYVKTWSPYSSIYKIALGYMQEEEVLPMQQDL